MFAQPVIPSHLSICSMVKSALCFMHMWLKPKYTEVLFAVAASIVSAMTRGMYSFSLDAPSKLLSFFVPACLLLFFYSEIFQVS